MRRALVPLTMRSFVWPLLKGNMSVHKRLARLHLIHEQENLCPFVMELIRI